MRRLVRLLKKVSFVLGSKCHSHNARRDGLRKATFWLLAIVIGIGVMHVWQKLSFSVLKRSINSRHLPPIIGSTTAMTLFNLVICDFQRLQDAIQLSLSFMGVAGSPNMVTSLRTFRTPPHFPRLSLIWE